ncbi:MAG: sigma-54 dependent transcriptional regulator [Acidobacteriota bacterium]
MTMLNGKRVKLLIAEDEKNFGLVLQKELSRRNYDVSLASDGRSALEFCNKVDYDVVVMDIMMPNLTGLEALKAIKETDPSPEVIILTGNATVETAIDAMKSGAYDYLTKPCKIEELDVLIRKAYERRHLQKENLHMQVRLNRKESKPTFITQNRKMREVLAFVERVAQTESSALIVGESGVGKELIAQSLHRLSSRQAGPFIDINCGAIQDTLLESEMFGYEKGAFTNADTSKPGLFELADHGTLFLDEIGELSLRLQVKLLRVLETRSFFRVGGTKQVRADVRLVAATNKNLAAETAESRFRQDLLYRINTVTIEIPPLRDRVDDIPLLVEHFLKYPGSNSFQISPETLEVLSHYAWPGNVRELKNVIERATILTANGVITPDCLPPEIYNKRKPQVVPELPPQAEKSVSSEPRSLAELEKEQILKTLEKVNWHRGKAANVLGITPKTLYRKLKSYGL